MAKLILPLITGAQTATCTICNSKAERAVVTDESCPVIEALCLICTRSAIAIEVNSREPLTWEQIADTIRAEASDERVAR